MGMESYMICMRLWTSLPQMMWQVTLHMLGISEKCFQKVQHEKNYHTSVFEIMDSRKHIS